MVQVRGVPCGICGGLWAGHGSYNSVVHVDWGYNFCALYRPSGTIRGVNEASSGEVVPVVLALWVSTPVPRSASGKYTGGRGKAGAVARLASERLGVKVSSDEVLAAVRDAGQMPRAGRPKGDPLVRAQAEILAAIGDGRLSRSAMTAWVKEDVQRAIYEKYGYPEGVRP